MGTFPPTQAMKLQRFEKFPWLVELAGKGTPSREERPTARCAEPLMQSTQFADERGWD